MVEQIDVPVVYVYVLEDVFGVTVEQVVVITVVFIITEDDVMVTYAR